MTSAPSARIRAILRAVRPARREDDGRDAEGPGGVRDALAEVAGRRADDRAGPARSCPPPARAATATHVPRPLNERIGLTVSTLTITGTPSRADRPSWTYCGAVAEDRVDRGVGGPDRRRLELRDREHRDRDRTRPTGSGDPDAAGGPYPLLTDVLVTTCCDNLTARQPRPAEESSAPMAPAASRARPPHPARSRLRRVVVAALDGCSATSGSRHATAERAAGTSLGWQDELTGGPDKLDVATTVAPISSIARNIGGDRIRLRGIIPDATNSHTFEPAPSDAQTLAKADLIIVNGLHLEQPTLDLAEASKRATRRDQGARRQHDQRGRVAVRLQLPGVGRRPESAPLDGRAVRRIATPS